MSGELISVCKQHGVDPSDVVYFFRLRNGEPRLILKDDFNPVYLRALGEDARIKIIYGGRGSGKSQDRARHIVADVLDGRNYLCCRYFKTDLKNSLFNEIMAVIDDWGIESEFDIQQQTMLITCKQNGRQIIFGALEDPKRLKSLKPKRGVLTDIFFEEADECPNPATFQTLNDCLRGMDADAIRKGRPQPSKHLYMCFNPPYKSHWIYEYFFVPLWHKPDVLNVDELKRQTYEDKTARGKVGGLDTFILKTTYLDNHYLTEDDIAQREGADGSNFWTGTLGNFGVLGDTVFVRGEDWIVQDLIALEKAGKISLSKNVRCGNDFGFVDPNAFIKCSVDRENRKIYIFDESYTTRLTTPQIIEIIADKCVDHVVYCDFAEQDRIKEFRQAGIHAVNCKKGSTKAKKSVKTMRIEWLHKFQIVVDLRCVNFINEMELYAWKQDQAGRPLPIPEDKNDHGIDALCYALGHDIFGGSKLVGTTMKLI